MSTLWAQLTWSHIRLLFSLNIDKINYYIKTTIQQHLSVRNLECRIKNKEYERLPEDTKNKLINQDKTIGIIICRKDNKYVIEYSSDSRILSREYELI